MVKNNDINVSHGSTYDDAYSDGCNNIDTSDRFGTDIDVQVVKNNNLFSDYDDDFDKDTYDDDDDINRKPINNSICLFLDQLDHLYSIYSLPDPYSNKHRNQPNHHDFSKQDLYGLLKHV